VERGAFVAQLFPCGFASSFFSCKQRKHDIALIVFYTERTTGLSLFKKVPLYNLFHLHETWSGRVHQLKSVDEHCLPCLTPPHEANPAHFDEWLLGAGRVLTNSITF
jgi:hypothetical protein